MAARKKRRKPAGGDRQAELPLNTQPTLKELVGWYLDSQETQLRKRTLRCRRSILNLATAALPARPTAGDVREWLSGRVERRELTGNSANQALKNLGRVYRLARDLRYPGLLNVIAAVKPFPVVRRKPKALPDPARDWPKCLAACEDVHERAFLSVMRRLGLRLGEALGLEPRHVDLSAGTLEIEQHRHVDSATAGPLKTDTSAGKKKLHPETAALLRQVLASRRARERGLVPAGEVPRRGRLAATFLFPFWGKRLDELLTRLRAAVPAAFQKRERGGTGGAAWHVFRHTYATALAATGMKDRDLQRALRHKDLSTTAAYLDSVRGQQEPEDALEKAWEAEAAAERAAQQQEAATVLPDARQGNTQKATASTNHTRKRGTK